MVSIIHVRVRMTPSKPSATSSTPKDGRLLSPTRMGVSVDALPSKTEPSIPPKNVPLRLTNADLAVRRILGGDPFLNMEKALFECADIGPESLETEDFKIERTPDWKASVLEDGTKVAIHPLGDVVELLDGEFVGTQLFEIFAAFRETRKAGRRMPTNTEWIKIAKRVNPRLALKTEWQKDVAPYSLRETLKARLAGYRSTSPQGMHCSRGIQGNYWSSTPIYEEGRERLRAGYVMTFSHSSEVFPLGIREWRSAQLVRVMKRGL